MWRVDVLHRALSWFDFNSFVFLKDSVSFIYPKLLSLWQRWLVKRKCPCLILNYTGNPSFLVSVFSTTHKALKVILTNYEFQSFKLHFRYVFGRVVDNFTLPEWQSNIMAWHSAVWFEISALFGRGQSLTSTCLFHRLPVVQTTEAACWCFLSYRWTLRTVYLIILLSTISFGNWSQ